MVATILRGSTVQLAENGQKNGIMALKSLEKSNYIRRADIVWKRACKWATHSFNMATKSGKKIFL